MSSSKAVDALRQAGNSLFGGKRYDEAAKKYSEALLISASDELARVARIKCLTNRAQCYSKMGQRELALSDYDTALAALNGTDETTLMSKAHFNSGHNLEALGQYDKAIDHYQKALSLGGGKPDEVEKKLQECENKLMQSRKGGSAHGYVSGVDSEEEGSGALNTPSRSPSSSSSPSHTTTPSDGSSQSKVGTALKVFNINFTGSSPSPPKEETFLGSNKGPALHPVIMGLSSVTLQSSPLKIELEYGKATAESSTSSIPKVSFYDGDGIIVSNSNSLDHDDSAEAEASSLGVRPSQAKQKYDIDKLLQQCSARTGPESNSVWFLLDKKWWTTWREFVDASPSSPSSSAEQKNFGAAVSVTALSPIDNWTLTTFSAQDSATEEEKSTNLALRQCCKYNTCSLHLRLGLVEDVDFVVLPRDAWEALRTWYGGGPPLPRAAVSTAGVLDLYPATPLTVAELSGLGAAASGRSPGGSSVHLTTSPNPDSRANGRSEAGLSIDETVFNDCGRSVRSVDGKVRKYDSCFVCQKLSYSKCANCKAVYYCDAECQGVHWKYHKAWCKQAKESSQLPFLEFQKKVPVGRRGKMGLINMGNSCYLNSSLQCLSHIKELTTYFLSGRYKQDLNRENFMGTKGLLADEYGLLMQELWFRNDKSIQPTAIRRLLARLVPEWAGLSQQDSHEVASKMIDWLHEDLNRNKSKPYVERREGDGSTNDSKIAAEYWSSLTKRDDSIVRDILGSFSSSRVTCLHCNKNSVSFEMQYAIYVPIPRSTKRNFRIFYIPWCGADSPLSTPLEIAVEVDRLATIYALKKGVSRRLAQLCPRLITTAQDLFLCEYNESLGQVMRFYHPVEDDSGVARIRESTSSLAAFLMPSDMYQALTHDEKVPLILLHQRVIQLGGSTQKISLADFPVLLPVWPNTMTCWKIRNIIWKHISGFVRSDSPLGKLLAGADKLQRVQLELALPLVLPLRMVTLGGGGGGGAGGGGGGQNDRESLLKPMISPNAINSEDKYRSEQVVVNLEATKRLKELGLSINGGLNWNAFKVLGSILPVDKDIETASLLRSGHLCMDWSDQWLEQLDIDALLKRGAVRDETAVQAFPTVPSGKAAANTQTAGMRRRSPSGSENPITLEQCLRDYFKEEMLGESEGWKCPNCKDEPTHPTKKLLTLMSTQLPNVLLVNLKRQEHRDVSSLIGRPGGGYAYQEKIDTYVDFPLEGLNVAPFCDDPHAERTIYDLFAVSNHYGRMGFGHYTACARDVLIDGTVSDAWTFYDDDDVRPVDDPADIKTSAAYMLFYKRRD